MRRSGTGQELICALKNQNCSPLNLWRVVASRRGGTVARIISPEDRPKLGALNVLEVTLVNSGSSPAKNVSGKAFIGLLDAPISTDDPPYPKTAAPISSVSVVPRDGPLIYHAPYEGTLRADDILAIQNSRKFLVIYGIVDYMDVFNRHWQTKFCFHYRPDTDDMAACPAHNTIN